MRGKHGDTVGTQRKEFSPACVGGSGERLGKLLCLRKPELNLQVGLRISHRNELMGAFGEEGKI